MISILTYSSSGYKVVLAGLVFQTLRFTKEMGRFTGLRAAVVLGGDSLEGQFAAMHDNPDIIIATPGR